MSADKPVRMRLAAATAGTRLEPSKFVPGGGGGGGGGGWPSSEYATLLATDAGRPSAAGGPTTAARLGPQKGAN